MGFEILKGYGADPQMVRPFGSVSVSIPPQDGIRMRNEIKYTCNGGGGRTTHDTQFTQVPLLDRWNHADFVLHHNMHTSSYFISGNFH